MVMLNERLMSGSESSMLDSYCPGPGVAMPPENMPRCAAPKRPSFVPKHMAVVCCLRKPSFGCLGTYWPGPGTCLMRTPPCEVLDGRYIEKCDVWSIGVIVSPPGQPGSMHARTPSSGAGAVLDLG